MPGRRRERRTERSKLDATPPWETRQRAEAPATTGPYDERDAPDDDLARIDLGALRVPVMEGTELRVEVDDQQQVVAVSLVRPDGHMQLGVFAAPRTEGIWDEVRAEIAASVNQQRGHASERADGRFGVELTGTLPGEGGRVPVRFIGIDGPRWFVRATLVGRVATDAALSEVFEDALRNLVVVRGPEPLPAREPVPLRLPKEMAATIESTDPQQI
jgi:hypothetical protein